MDSSSGARKSAGRGILSMRSLTKMKVTGVHEALLAQRSPQSHGTLNRPLAHGSSPKGDLSQDSVFFVTQAEMRQAVETSRCRTFFCSSSTYLTVALGLTDASCSAGTPLFAWTPRLKTRGAVMPCAPSLVDRAHSTIAHQVPHTRASARWLPR